MTTKPAIVKVYLQNARSMNTMCGYGEGFTREEAINDALRLGKQRDPNAYYDGRQVVFAESVRL